MAALVVVRNGRIVVVRNGRIVVVRNGWYSTCKPTAMACSLLLVCVANYWWVALPAGLHCQLISYQA